MADILMADTPPAHHAFPLEARSITVDYGGRPILTDLDFAVPRQAFTVLLGPNGSGKSTLLRTLAGLVAPRRGEVRLDDQPMRSFSARQRARRLSLLPQSPHAPEDISVRALVEQGRYPHRGLFERWTEADSAACEEALALTDMQALANRPLSHLSGGQRQRAWVAMTLAQTAEILLLDEPTTYLDIAHQLDVLHLVRKLVQEQRKTVVAILHDINQAARFADHMVFMKAGAITAAGKPAEIMHASIIADVFDIEALIIADPEDDTPVCLARR